jgi:hypothetical protein
MRPLRFPSVRRGRVAAALSLAAGVSLGLGAAGVAQTPTAPRQQTPQPSGLIAGVVVIADSGLPLDGVRVTLSGAEIRGSRRVQTDDDGRFSFMGLPPGRYTLSATKTGYVDVTYGQREPGGGRQGTPIQLVEGQAVKNLNLPIPKGGVITGRVFDEKGRPSVGTPVRVSRWIMTNGQRRLVSSGSSTTDDRGVYRVYGLAPSAYIVHAVPRNQADPQAANAFLVENLQRDAQAAAATGVQITGGGRLVTLGSESANAGEGSGTRVGYAPVYYPGTLDVATAQTVDLGVGEERVGVDMYLQQVPLTTVAGMLLIPPGVNMSNVRVRLVSSGISAPGVGTLSSRAGRDGMFSFGAVAPGQYRAFAVASVRNVPASAVGSMLGGEPLPPGNNTIQFWAAADVHVYSEEVSGLTLSMQPGMIVASRQPQPRAADTHPRCGRLGGRRVVGEHEPRAGRPLQVRGRRARPVSNSPELRGVRMVAEVGDGRRLRRARLPTRGAGTRERAERARDAVGPQRGVERHDRGLAGTTRYRLHGGPLPERFTLLAAVVAPDRVKTTGDRRALHLPRTAGRRIPSGRRDRPRAG